MNLDKIINQFFRGIIVRTALYFGSWCAAWSAMLGKLRITHLGILLAWSHPDIYRNEYPQHPYIPKRGIKFIFLRRQCFSARLVSYPSFFDFGRSCQDQRVCMYVVYIIGCPSRPFFLKSLPMIVRIFTFRPSVRRRWLTCESAPLSGWIKVLLCGVNICHSTSLSCIMHWLCYHHDWGKELYS